MSERPATLASMESVQILVRDGSFEETLLALEAVVDHLERGRLALADAVLWYEAGLGLSRRCADLLAAAELQISTLDERYGTQEPEPWDDDEA